MKADQGDALAEHAAVCHPALKWMRLVNDEPVQIPRRVLDSKRSSFACCSEFRKGVLGGGQCQTAFPRVSSHANRASIKIR
jgi:hypothetical protein